MHDPKLLDVLAGHSVAPFEGTVFRATLAGRDPLSFSTAGGRWMARDGMAVLYTSLTKEGAIAEVVYRFSQLTPLPSKPIKLHTLQVKAHRLLQIEKSNFDALGIDSSAFESYEYSRCQAVGAAVGWLQNDAMRVPNARWECSNVVLFADNGDLDNTPEIISSDEIDWQAWAATNGLL
jgi:hypothetical protein